MKYLNWFSRETDNAQQGELRRKSTNEKFYPHNQKIKKKNAQAEQTPHPASKTKESSVKKMERKERKKVRMGETSCHAMSGTIIDGTIIAELIGSIAVYYGTFKTTSSIDAKSTRCEKP